jgi:alginate O-acetyltransferase complex protein AlgI
MVFSSAAFLYVFAPLFFSIYYLTPPRYRNAVLLCASLAFYTAGAGVIVVVLLLSACGNHLLALRLHASDRRSSGAWLAAGIALNLAGLIYYKYLVFLWNLADEGLRELGVQPLGPALEVSLPIGISFFTFQAISYIVDVYRRDTPPARSGLEFATYHTLFPQLIAGPIVRYREISGQLFDRRIDLTGLSEGAWRVCIGFGKKIILADNLGVVADQIIQLPRNELTCAHSWLGILCYALQIYYDFSGYSDMAIGLGKMLGFDFPENFNQPYRAQNVTEFWRRWHMTLTRWFRDYVYIPLGGNRGGILRTCRNLALVFCLCGLWHGAGLNFLVWGIYHGVLLAIERVLDRLWGWRPRGLLGTVLTFVLVTIGWVFFRIEDFAAAAAYLSAMFGAGAAGIVYFPLRHFLEPDTCCYLAIAVAGAFAPIERLGWESAVRPAVTGGRLAFGLLVFAYGSLQLAANSFNPFIYFRF